MLALVNDAGRPFSSLKCEKRRAVGIGTKSFVAIKITFFRGGFYGVKTPFIAFRLHPMFSFDKYGMLRLLSTINKIKKTLYFENEGNISVRVHRHTVGF